MPIILFDGVCNLCNGAVQFVIRHDRKNIFQFAALQSDFGIRELNKLKRSAEDFDSIILLDEGAWDKSTAILKIGRRLNGLWPACYIFIIVPKFVRDWFYDRVANNRYRIFGRSEACMIPTKELKAKFLE